MTSSEENYSNVNILLILFNFFAFWGGSLGFDFVFGWGDFGALAGAYGGFIFLVVYLFNNQFNILYGGL